MKEKKEKKKRVTLTFGTRIVSHVISPERTEKEKADGIDVKTTCIESKAVLLKEGVERQPQRPISFAKVKGEGEHFSFWNGTKEKPSRRTRRAKREEHKTKHWKG